MSWQNSRPVSDFDSQIIHARTASRFTADRMKGPGNKYYRSRDTAILKANFLSDTNKPTVLQLN